MLVKRLSAAAVLPVRGSAVAQLNPGVHAFVRDDVGQHVH